MCVVTMVLIFLCGAAFGALAMNLGAHNRLHKAPFWTESGKAISLEKLKNELELTPAQTEQVALVLDDFVKYYRTVLSDGKTRIMQLLNEEQRRRYERLMQPRSY